LEPVERGGRLAALEESHSRQQIDLALPLRGEGKDLEAARARLEDLVRERLAQWTGHLQEQAIRSPRKERPAVAHRGRGGSPGEEPDRGRGIADRLVARSVRVGRDVLGRAAWSLGIVLVAALADGGEPFARRI